MWVGEAREKSIFNCLSFSAGIYMGGAYMFQGWKSMWLNLTAAFVWRYSDLSQCYMEEGSPETASSTEKNINILSFEAMNYRYSLLLSCWQWAHQLQRWLEKFGMYCIRK